MTNSTNDPLWVIAMMAGDSTPGHPRDAFAAQLRVIADWLVPLEPEPPSSDNHPWPQSYQLMSDSKWEQRMLLREKLLAEADRAEASH